MAKNRPTNRPGSVTNTVAMTTLWASALVSAPFSVVPILALDSINCHHKWFRPPIIYLIIKLRETSSCDSRWFYLVSKVQLSSVLCDACNGIKSLFVGDVKTVGLANCEPSSSESSKRWNVLDTPGCISTVSTRCGFVNILEFFY